MASYNMCDEVLSGWRIVRSVGDGAYGHVFEVQKDTYGFTSKSALKVVSIPPSQSMVTSALSEGMTKAEVADYFSEVTRRFVGEAALLSSLPHPGIVEYRDHQVIPHEDGMGQDVLLLMELLESLPERIVARGLPDPSEVVQLGLQISDALAFCHARGIIHRDVKPENVFVDSGGHYKLGDFGVSRVVEGTMGGFSRQGTEDYMAPELYRGEDYGPDVDVYALGLMMYKLLNGNRPPFVSEPGHRMSFADRQ